MAERYGERPYNEVRFRIPISTERFVHRPRLTAQLDQSAHLPLTVVSGPAGTGKTLAVADWTRQGTQAGTVAWVSLDKGDASVTKFWGSMLAALRIASPETMSELRKHLNPESAFLQDIAARVGRLTLVLDDAHAIESGTTIQWLEDLLRWPPEGLHIVLVTRHEPPLPLQRMRLEEAVAEVRFQDLTFTRDEGRALLAEGGVHLQGSTLDQLMTCTGGWAAALRLVAARLRSASDPAETIARFGRIAFPISEYLWEEVLQNLPSSYNEFLQRTSVCSKLCAPLAAELSGEAGAAQMLQNLSREQLLSHELADTGCYRAHSLLNTLLHARLKATRPQLEQEQQRIAALWYERHGQWMQALTHAVASEDWDFAGALAVRSGAVALFGADRHRFLDLVATIPGAATIDNPELAVTLAAAAYSQRDATTVAVLLDRASPGVDTLPEPRRSIAAFAVHLITAGQAHRDSDGVALRRSATLADNLLAGIRGIDAPGWSEHRGLTTTIRGVADLWAGNPYSALARLNEGAATLPLEEHTAFTEVYTRGLIAVAEGMAGWVDRSRATAEEAIEVAEREGHASRSDTQWAWLARSAAQLRAGNLEAARASRQRCAEVAGAKFSPFVRVELNLLAARHALATGDPIGARRRLEAAGGELEARRGIESLRPQLVGLQVDLALAQHDSERAAQLLDTHERGHDREVGNPHLVQVARARRLLSTGNPAGVRDAVAETLGTVGFPAVRAWVAVSAAEDQLRRDSQAVEAMAEALNLAASDDVALPLVRPNYQLAMALRRHLDLVGTHREFVERALATIATDPEEEVRTLLPLTERERAVLFYLPTMASNAEIASALCVSENTIKQHLKSIYRKLSVGSRREAVRVARAAGLLYDVGVSG